jgi:AcrR family transcriptional regulator
MPAVDEDGKGTRERLVSEGLRLFAERGFRGTTVGEIERAAGLTPRAGALYNHFGSKEAVLEAAFDRHVRDLEAMHSAIELMPLGDLRAELTLLARWGLTMLEQQRELRRIVIAEGERFPALREGYRERIVERSYAEAVAFVRRKIDEGELPEADAEALSALVIGAMLGYTLELDVFGREPLGVDRERFVTTFVDACMAIAERGRKEDGDG